MPAGPHGNSSVVGWYHSHHQPTSRLAVNVCVDATKRHCPTTKSIEILIYIYTPSHLYIHILAIYMDIHAGTYIYVHSYLDIFRIYQNQYKHIHTHTYTIHSYSVTDMDISTAYKDLHAYTYIYVHLHIEVFRIASIA